MMTRGAADRLDVTGWIPTARTTATPRSNWDAAGVAARAGDASQDRFGAALVAARARDDAEATRTRDDTQRSQSAAARNATQRTRDAADLATTRAARQDSQKPSPADAHAVRAQPDAVQAETAQDKAAQAKAVQQAERAPVPSVASADTRPAKPAGSTEPAQRSDPTVDPAAPTAETDTQAVAGTDAAPAAPPADTADKSVTDPAEPDSTKTDPVLAAPTETAAQAAAPAATPTLPGTLQALMAELVKGGPVRTEGAVQGGDGQAVGATGAIGSDIAGAAGTGIRGSRTAHATAASDAGAGLSGPGRSTAKAGAVSTTPQTASTGTSPVEAVTAGSGDAAGSAAVSSAGPDFIAALADAGQGSGQTLTAPALAAAAPAAADLSALAPQANVAGSSAASSAVAVPPQTAALRQPDPPVPIGQVPMTIGLRSLAGSSEFQIRLDPAELGRIDVKLEIDKARGTVTTHLVVERPETLAMLQRDAGQLQQALSQAGLDSSAGGLNLSLRSDGNAQGGGSGGQGDAPRGGATAWSRETAETPQEIAPTRWLRGYGGVDIRI